MRALRPSLAPVVLLLAFAAGCGSRAPEVTGLLVNVELDGIAPTQLELTVDSPTAEVVGPKQRPEQEGAALAGTQSVSIFLPDALAGTEVTCTVTPLERGRPSGPSGSARVMLVKKKLVSVKITLTSVPSDGGSIDADASGAAGKDGAAGTGGGGGSTDGSASEAAPEGPVLKGLGQACGADGECDSELCVDGVCCGSPCGDSCMACNLSGKEGICSPVAAGNRTVGTARQACVDQGPQSCGYDGKCDGFGACRKYAPGVGCKAASCQGASFLPASACDGQGNCSSPKAVDCTPYNCTTTPAPACGTTCTTGGNECVAPAVCANSSCGQRAKMANGSGCLADADCLSTHCADGVCCATACTGACMACNLSGDGTCQNVAMNKADPHGVCKDAGATTCGRNGLCNGSGACALYPATTTCAAGSCKNTTLTPPRHCDGKGACAAATDVECSPFRCDSATSACFTSCTVGALQCAQHHPCVNSSCQ